MTQDMFETSAKPGTAIPTVGYFVNESISQHSKRKTPTSSESRAVRVSFSACDNQGSNERTTATNTFMIASNRSND